MSTLDLGRRRGQGNIWADVLRWIMLVRYVRPPQGMAPRALGDTEYHLLEALWETPFLCPSPHFLTDIFLPMSQAILSPLDVTRPVESSVTL